MEAKALIVDFGGVLTTNVWDSFAAFCEAEGLDPGTVKELFRGDAEALTTLRMLERGELEDEEFEQRFGDLLGIERHEDLIDRLFAGLAPDESMLAAVRSARAAGIRTGLISNSWGTGIYERGHFDGLFDAAVISGEVGMHKPEPEIFRLACERLGVEPGDCVFVDDLRENCEGAEAVGMTAVLHRDSAATVTELERLLGLALAPG
jgi:epoxide hydrolase-like predicted phosphatase